MSDSLWRILSVTAAAVLLDQAWFSLTLKSIYYPAITAVTGQAPVFAYLPAVLSWFSVGSLVVLLQTLCPLLTTIPYSTVIGGLVYAVYNMTVKAIFPNYTWPAAILDTIWGGVLVSVLFRVAQSIPRSP